MIANVIHFYGGGITVSEAEKLPLSRLDRYLKRADEINQEMKKAQKNGI